VESNNQGRIKLMNIVLTGFMGTGKSKIGRRLAKKLRMSYLDTDELIEEREKDSISAIFKKRGEEYFRRLETKVVKEVALLDNYVISTGGGVVLREGNIRVLKKNAFIVCLFASPEVILKRTKGDEKRPVLKGDDRKERIEELLAIRKSYYEKADFSVDTSTLDSKKVVEEIVKFLERRNTN
jgi:shikimate kinase